MKQVLQNYRTGDLTVREAPAPALKRGGVLVRTAFSLISAGTERTTLETARNSLVGKAIQRPDLVSQVMDTLKREGLAATYNKVKARLDQVKPLGYSASGVVLAADDRAQGLAVGDRVACAGAGYACHSEINFVPASLCARVPDNVSLEAASYTTVGAIALHGVRLSEAHLGEVVAVIGLGLVGQLAVQLLKAGGCSVLGIDPDSSACYVARLFGADSTAVDDAGALAACAALSSGRGADSIVIAAGTKSNGPIKLAGELARDRARVIVIGAVGMDVPRNDFYHKELDVRISRSYGPGRYDRRYEEEGADYPIGYVRWTEKRNMEAFLGLAAQSKVKPALLSTHRFSIDQAGAAYDVILGKAPDARACAPSGDSPPGAERLHESFPPGYRCGVVLEYPGAATPQPSRILFGKGAARAKGRVGIGFIGAGSFARAVLLPILKTTADVRLAGVTAATGSSAVSTAEQFGFHYCASHYSEIIDDPEIDCVFVATRHDSHHSLAAECLAGGKHVFVEKPLALDAEGLRHVLASARDAAGGLFVGYNRRFSPLAVAIKKALGEAPGPVTVLYRINAGRLASDHWARDPQQGGGRVIGEVCHFVDFAAFITGSLPVQVSAQGVVSGNLAACDDGVAASIRMQNGSIASILYAASGDPSAGKERIEIFSGGMVGVIDDFKSGQTVRSTRRTKLANSGQDKGHAAEIASFLNQVRGESPPVFTLESLAAVSLTTFGINESIASGVSVTLDPSTVLDH